MIMVFTKIKPQLDRLSRKEMVKTMAYMKHVLRAENPEYQQELARRHADIETGQGISLTEIKRRFKRA